MHNNSTAFDYAKEITVAKLANSGGSYDKQSAKEISEFFEIVFDKLVELEDKSKKMKNASVPVNVMK